MAANAREQNGNGSESEGRRVVLPSLAPKWREHLNSPPLQPSSSAFYGYQNPSQGGSSMVHASQEHSPLAISNV